MCAQSFTLGSVYGKICFKNLMSTFCNYHNLFFRPLAVFDGIFSEFSSFHRMDFAFRCGHSQFYEDRHVHTGLDHPCLQCSVCFSEARYDPTRCPPCLDLLNTIRAEGMQGEAFALWDSWQHVCAASAATDLQADYQHRSTVIWAAEKLRDFYMPPPQRFSDVSEEDIIIPEASLPVSVPSSDALGKSCRGVVVHTSVPVSPVPVSQVFSILSASETLGSREVSVSHPPIVYSIAQSNLTGRSPVAYSSTNSFPSQIQLSVSQSPSLPLMPAPPTVGTHSTTSISSATLPELVQLLKAQLLPDIVSQVVQQVNNVERRNRNASDSPDPCSGSPSLLEGERELLRSRSFSPEPYRDVVPLSQEHTQEQVQVTQNDQEIPVDDTMITLSDTEAEDAGLPFNQSARDPLHRKAHSTLLVRMAQIPPEEQLLPFVHPRASVHVNESPYYLGDLISYDMVQSLPCLLCHASAVPDRLFVDQQYVRLKREGDIVSFFIYPPTLPPHPMFRPFIMHGAKQPPKPEQLRHTALVNTLRPLFSSTSDRYSALQPSATKATWTTSAPQSGPASQRLEHQILRGKRESLKKPIQCLVSSPSALSDFLFEKLLSLTPPERDDKDLFFSFFWYICRSFKEGGFSQSRGG